MNPHAWPAAIEEILRYESPIQMTEPRRRQRDVRLGDVLIPAGESIALLYGSGNRDDRRFEDGDRFDVRRRATWHLAFGDGIHFCLGAHLARLEAAVALPLLLDEFGDYELAEEPTRIRSAVLRSVLRLPIARGPRRGRRAKLPLAAPIGSN